MAVYMILDIEVLDADQYAEYVRQAPATVEQYGGRYLVRGGAVTPLTGSWEPQRMVVLEFPSRERFDAWLTSPEYSAISPIREEATISNAIIVDGYDA
jgi:uncharacterized protein (DUF1330 family)